MLVWLCIKQLPLPLFPLQAFHFNFSLGFSPWLYGAGRRAGDRQTSLQTPTSTWALGSSQKAVNKVSQEALSDKARTISIWVNSHPSDQAGLIHTGPWEQALGEHTLAEVDTELGSVLPVQQYGQPCVSTGGRALPLFSSLARLQPLGPTICSVTSHRDNWEHKLATNSHWCWLEEAEVRVEMGRPRCDEGCGQQQPALDNHWFF